MVVDLMCRPGSLVFVGNPINSINWPATIPPVTVSLRSGLLSTMIRLAAVGLVWHTRGEPGESVTLNTDVGNEP